MACYNGAVSFEGLDNNNDGQRWEKNIVEHKGIGVLNHDEAENDNTLEYDDQEVEWYHNDVGGLQDLADNGKYAAEGDQEHEDYDEEYCTQNDGCVEEWIEEGGYADDHAEHAWENGYAEWNAEEDECDDGKDDYDEYGESYWDDMWAAGTW